MEVSVKVNGVGHLVRAELMGGDLWVHHHGKTFIVDTRQGRKSRKKAGLGGNSNQVNAPMPGKITKILANVGTDVVVGQAVLVMEAMKMEYTLKSEIAGTVENILCEVGEQVSLGKTLVKLAAKTDTKEN